MWRLLLIAALALTNILSVQAGQPVPWKEALLTYLRFENPKFPLRISDNLTVLGADFGKYPPNQSPFNHSKLPVKFIPTSVLKSDNFSYGYRLKVDSKKKTIAVTERLLENGTSATIDCPVVNGAVYREWIFPSNVTGPYRVLVTIDGKPVRTIKALVQL